MAEKGLDEATSLYLNQLESRRAACDQAMWQAPTLTIVAQSFLLQVLGSIESDAAATAILVAGVLACVAAGISLLRLREREVRFTREIVHRFKEAGYDGFDPSDIPARAGGHHQPLAKVDARARRWASWDRWPPVYWFWVLTIAAFAVADGYVYCGR